MGNIIRLRSDAEKSWQHVAADESLPQQQDVIVPLARLPEALAANHLTAVGVRIEPGEDVYALTDHLSRISLVELSFPTFRDGRNYSSARILREELGYTGEIRAVGDVLVDQLHFMVRSGIDSLQLHPDVKLESAQAALARWQHVYQKSADDRTAVWQQRA
jgi:uncharacterized protein (DUF934 family)